LNVLREAFFLETGRGRRFCLLTRPASDPVGTLLYLPPLAEEMNKSRRMAALAANAFASAGWAVLQIDLFGCGDSDGDFGDAGWKDWIDDVDSGWSWLCRTFDLEPWIWTLRGGSLLAADWMKRSGNGPNVLMWQPVTNGQQHLAQFMRLKVASEMLVESDAKNVMTRMREALKAGESVEIAGYQLSPALASGFDGAKLAFEAGYAARCVLIEVASAGRQEASPALRMLEQRSSEAGVQVALEVVPGTAFWQTQEIEVVPALIEKSRTLLQDVPADALS